MHMRTWICVILGQSLGLGWLPVTAQDSPLIVDAASLDADAAVVAVTLYPGRAAVTRSAHLSLQAGAYDVRFADLPASIQPQSLQARSSGGEVKVLSVDFVQRATADTATSPELAQLDASIAQAAAALRRVADERDLIKSQEDFLAALTVRTTSDASARGGTEQLDLDALRNQMEFIRGERERLQERRRDADARQSDHEKQLAVLKAERDASAAHNASAREAIIRIATPQAFEGDLSLTYLVAEATWEPTYSVRAASDFSSAQIEYDAVLAQRTGEDWNDVRLTLSTAQPAVAANPPTISPWYVDIVDAARSEVMVAAPAAASRDRAGADAADKFRNWSQDAAVAGGGPSVTFALPRAVTIKTNIERQQRTRIATINSPAEFVHVATPALTEAVYVRGDLVNASAFQLLAGRTSIFVGQDYVGATTTPAVAPNGRFQMHFGIDQSVRVQRQVLSKTTESTGLLSGGRRTTSSYRIVIDNGSGRALNLELWDRVPVSRNEEIQIQMLDLSTKLVTDAEYVTQQQPQGLLKWWLSVPATARDQNAMAITYAVRIDRAKDVQMTPLPE